MPCSGELQQHPAGPILLPTHQSQLQPQRQLLRQAPQHPREVRTKMRMPKGYHF